MPAGGRHLDGEPAEPLAADVNQVGLPGTVVDGRGRGWLGPRLPAAQGFNQAGKGRSGAHQGAADNARFSSTSGRNHNGWLADCIHERNYSGNRTNRAIETELADERHLPDVRRQQNLARDEQGDGDREVQAGSPLAHP